MQSAGRKLIREGYLDIKYPERRTKKVGKVWHRRWVKASQVCGADSVPRLRLDFCHNEGTNCVPFHLEVRRSVMFRSWSKSHPHKAFGIGSRECGDFKVALYLAADHERHAQAWMKTLRDAIYPPIPWLLDTDTSLSKKHYISLIDSESSFRLGLLGNYGYMRVMDNTMAILNPHTGQLTAQWSLQTLKRAKMIRCDYENSPSGVVSVSFLLGNKKDKELTLCFYSPTARDAAKDLNNTSPFHSTSDSVTKQRLRFLLGRKDCLRSVSSEADLKNLNRTFGQNTEEEDQCSEDIFDGTDESDDDDTGNHEEFIKESGMENDIIQSPDDSSACYSQIEITDPGRIFDLYSDIPNSSFRRLSVDAEALYEELPEDLIPPILPPRPTTHRLQELSHNITTTLVDLQRNSYGCKASLKVSKPWSLNPIKEMRKMIKRANSSEESVLKTNPQIKKISVKRVISLPTFTEIQHVDKSVSELSVTVPPLDLMQFSEDSESLGHCDLRRRKSSNV